MFRKQHGGSRSADFSPNTSPTRISTSRQASTLSIRPFGTQKHGRRTSLSLKGGRETSAFATVVGLLKRILAVLLPRWLRSLKGFFGLLLLFITCSAVYFISYPPLDAATKARLAHERAERVLEDPLGATHHSSVVPGLSAKAAARRHQDLDPLRKAQASLPESLSSSSMHQNGLLVAKEGERHPILALIEKGKKDWEQLLARQSKTLPEAAAEYRKRHRKNPPAGFEIWWDFAQRNNVQLVDEYDQIMQDIKPFHSLEPQEFWHRYQFVQGRDLTFTLVIEAGEPNVYTTGSHAEITRADEMASLIESFSTLLPRDINMTFTIDDRPAIMLEWERKTRMNEVASEGEYFGPSDYVDSTDPLLSNFALACPPDSALRRYEKGERVPELEKQKSKKSFIWDADRSNDMCQHPEFKGLHGYTQTNETEITPLIPLYTFAKTTTHSDLLVTPLEQYWDSYEGYDPPWEEKRIPKLLWRGSTTGAHFKKGYPWRDSQRARLHFMTKETNGSREVLTTDAKGNAKLVSFPAATLNKLYMDTSFSGSPAQCDPVTCELMKKEIKFAATQGLEESFNYKYYMDVDGNGWSGRFHRLLWSNSLVLKSTVFPEWYAQRLIPWYHYVPVKVDYSDLIDIMAFFEGTPDGKGSHGELAQMIASNGRQWALENWRRADMASYCFRMLLEVSRLLYPDDSDYVDA